MLDIRKVTNNDKFEVSIECLLVTLNEFQTPQYANDIHTPCNITLSILRYGISQSYERDLDFYEGTNSYFTFDNIKVRLTQVVTGSVHDMNILYIE